MNDKENKGLFTLLYPIMSEIKLSIFLSALSAISLIISLIIISFTLSSILESEPIIFFNHVLDIFNIVLLIALFIVISFLSRLFSFVISHLGAFKLEEVLRTELSSHLAKIPLGYIISNGSGVLKKVLLTDVKNLHTFVADSIPMIAKSIVAPLISFVILIVIDYRLALASIFILIIGAIIMSIALRDSAKLRKEYEKSQSYIDKIVIEFVQAMPVVRTFDDGNESFKRFNNSLFLYRDSLKNWMSETRTSAKVGMLILSPLPTLLAVLFVGLIFLDRETLSLSSLIAALFLSTCMADALMPLMWLNSFILKSKASALRIQEVLSVKELPLSKNPKVPNHTSISFDNVSFIYENTDKNALSNISFTVLEGSTTALIGPSGAGKSTVAKLISRFWDISSGSIKIGNINIKDISSPILMDTVSFVFQDTFLFHDTLFNNIKMANPKSSYDDVINAAKAAQIHEFIISLPNSYETLAGDRGTNLSGGQKQRITIARAILRDAPIIILDEATSFADPQNEEEIIKAIANLMRDKTVIVIAHRLSTIKDVDQIIVFDEGKITERGKHQELLDNKCVYFKLWQNYKKSKTWNLENKQENI